MDSTATIYDQIPFSDMGHDDYLVRIQQSHNAEGETYIDFIEETNNFLWKYIQPFFENSILSHALKSLWLTHQYNQEYISFLLNTCTKDEFLKKAAEFARSFQEIDQGSLAFAVNLMLEKLGQPLTSAELSTLLNVDPATIEDSHLLLEEHTSSHYTEKDDV